MSRLQIGAVCLFLALLSIAATRYGGYPAINDYHDIEVYFQRGSWVTTGQEPYRDVFSEYPQVATWLFAVPHVAAEAWSRLNGTRQYDLQTYRYVFSVLMALFLAATLVMLHDLRPDRKWLVFLLLLPAGWYFTHNRFDIVPAFLVLASLAALRRNRYHGAFILLAIATATKWYALVLVPVFLVYTFHTRRRILFSAAVSYPLVLAVIVLPTLLAIGWEGFLIPYRFHLTRTGNPESLFHLLLVTLTRLGLFQPARQGCIKGKEGRGERHGRSCRVRVSGAYSVRRMMPAMRPGASWPRLAATRLPAPGISALRRSCTAAKMRSASVSGGMRRCSRRLSGLYWRACAVRVGPG